MNSRFRGSDGERHPVWSPSFPRKRESISLVLTELRHRTRAWKRQAEGAGTGGRSKCSSEEKQIPGHQHALDTPELSWHSIPTDSDRKSLQSGLDFLEQCLKHRFVADGLLEDAGVQQLFGVLGQATFREVIV